MKAHTIATIDGEKEKKRHEKNGPKNNQNHGSRSGTMPKGTAGNNNNKRYNRKRRDKNSDNDQKGRCFICDKKHFAKDCKELQTFRRFKKRMSSEKLWKLTAIFSPGLYLVRQISGKSADLPLPLPMAQASHSSVLIPRTLTPVLFRRCSIATGPGCPSHKCHLMASALSGCRQGDVGHGKRPKDLLPAPTQVHRYLCTLFGHVTSGP